MVENCIADEGAHSYMTGCTCQPSWSETRGAHPGHLLAAAVHHILFLLLICCPRCSVSCSSGSPILCCPLLLLGSVQIPAMRSSLLQQRSSTPFPHHLASDEKRRMHTITTGMECSSAVCSRPQYSNYQEAPLTSPHLMVAGRGVFVHGVAILGGREQQHLCCIGRLRGEGGLVRVGRGGCCGRCHAHELALHAGARLRELLAALVADLLGEAQVLALLLVLVQRLRDTGSTFENMLRSPWSLNTPGHVGMAASERD